MIRILDEAVIARLALLPAPAFPFLLLGGFKTLYIKPGSPWQNAYSESFKLPVPGLCS